MISIMEIKFFAPARLKGSTLAETWYVEWDQWHPIKQKAVRLRKTFDLNRLKTIAERRQRGKSLVKVVNARMADGYPFEHLAVSTIPDTRTLAQALDEIFELMKDGKRPDTVRSYHNSLQQLRKHLAKHNQLELPLGAFGRGEAMTFVDAIARRKPKVASRTINNYVAFYRTFWNAMVEREWIEINAWKDVRKLAQAKSKRNRFSAAQVEDMFAWMAAHDPQLLAYVMHMLCGVRRTELQRLRVRDVDYVRGTVTVSATHAKCREERTNTVLAEFLPHLRSRIEGAQPTDYLFGWLLRVDARPCGANRAYKNHVVAMEACGISAADGITLNSWRHTGASIFTERLGISIAQRQLGHNDPRTTMIYSKPEPFIAEVSAMQLSPKP